MDSDGSSKASHNLTAKSVDASWRHVASKVCPMLKYIDIMTTYIYATIALRLSYVCSTFIADVTTVIYGYKQICDHKRGWMPIKEWKFMFVLMFVWLGRLWTFAAVTYVAHTEDVSTVNMDHLAISIRSSHSYCTSDMQNQSLCWLLYNNCTIGYKINQMYIL